MPLYALTRAQKAINKFVQIVKFFIRINLESLLVKISHRHQLHIMCYRSKIVKCYLRFFFRQNCFSILYISSIYMAVILAQY